MTEKRKRRWLQFSLVSLLLVMTVLGLSLGLWTDSARRQEQAAEALRQDIQIRTSENTMPNDRYTPESGRSTDMILNDR